MRDIIEVPHSVSPLCGVRSQQLIVAPSQATAEANNWSWWGRKTWCWGSDRRSAVRVPMELRTDAAKYKHGPSTVPVAHWNLAEQLGFVSWLERGNIDTTHMLRDIVAFTMS